MAPFLHSWRLKKYSVPPSVKFMVTPLIEAQVKEEREAGVALQDASLYTDRLSRFFVYCDNNEVIFVGASYVEKAP